MLTKTQLKKLFSVAIALAVAWLFYQAACPGGSCLVVPGLNKVTAVNAPAVDKGYDQFPIPVGHTDFIPGGSYQDPGYFGGNVIQYGKHGSIGAELEGFTAGCLGQNTDFAEYPSAPFKQVACRPEPKWNLPRDARMQHEPMYPCGVPGQCNEAECYKHHPMDTIYAPPNEGIMTRQVRN